MWIRCAILMLMFLSTTVKSANVVDDLPKPAAAPYALSKSGVPVSADYFPIAVWLQEPRNAPKYKAIGINLYIGLWKGPTAGQLADLEKFSMPVICEQDLAFRDRKIIVGWMHGDEPDNAQELGGGKGYGPPVSTEAVVAEYAKLKKADPTRPVILNLGQGVAFDDYIGRGVRRNKPEDYPKYIAGSDIVSFDIYPATHDAPAVAGNLWFVPKGVSRLREWSKDEKVVWNCIECTHIGNEKVKPTPAQVKSEVWMSIIAGSRGVVYFSHEFKPKFIEAGLLADKEMAEAVGQINKRITSLAAVINSPTVSDLARVDSSNKDVPLSILCKKHGGSAYIFAAGMRDGETTATFAVPSLKGGAKVEVIDEDRTISAEGGKFVDSLKGYAVHLYKVAAE